MERPSTRDEPRTAEGDVTGARRHVDDEVIQLAPLDVQKELPDHAVQHGTAPDDRRGRVGEKAHRHDPDAELLRRLDLLTVRLQPRVEAEHDRHVGTVDVPVDDPDTPSVTSQRDGKIDRHGRLADAALPGADGDDVTDARNGRLLGVGHRGPDARGHLDVDGVHAAERGYRATQKGPFDPDELGTTPGVDDSA